MADLGRPPHPRAQLLQVQLYAGPSRRAEGSAHFPAACVARARLATGAASCAASSFPASFRGGIVRVPWAFCLRVALKTYEAHNEVHYVS